MRTIKRLTLICTMALLVACGGGSGGGGSIAPPAPDLLITADNAKDVASTVLTAAGLVGDLGEITTGEVSDPSAGVQQLALPTRLALFKTPALGQSHRIAPAAVVGPLTEPCESSGTVTLSGNVADPDTLTAGDQITATFNDCDDGEGFVVNGRAVLKVNAISGDPLTDVFTLSVAVTADNLTVTEGEDTFSADGDFTLDLDSIDFPVTLLTIAGTALNISAGADTLSFRRFTATYRADLGTSPIARRFEASGSVGSSVLGGRVGYRTVQAVEGLGEADPNAGVILITGANDATIRVVVVDSSSVRLEIDLDGDGIVDEFQDTTWSELEGDGEAGGATISDATAGSVAGEAFKATADLALVVGALSSQFSQNNLFVQLASLSVSGTFGPQFLPCDTGGASLSGQIATAGTYNAGDSVSVVFSDCTLAGAVFNGTIDVAIAGFSGTVGGAYAVNGTAMAAGLQRAAGDILTATGEWDFSFDTSQVPFSINSSVSDIELERNGITRRVRNATAQVNVNVAVAPPVRERTLSGTLDSTALDGSVTYATTTPLIETTDTDPATGASSGALRVTGAGDATVTAEALSDTLTVRLDLDLDGDGITDASQDSSWVELLN